MVEAGAYRWLFRAMKRAAGALLQPALPCLCTRPLWVQPMSLAVAAGCPFFRRVGTVAGAGLVLGVAGSISIGRCESEADAASGREQRRSEKFASLGAAVMEGPMGTLPPPPADKAGSDRPEYDGRPRVAFQGELGAYSEMAVTQHYGEGNAVPVPCDDFEELVRLVSSGQVERGLIPIENTLAGTIHKNYDLLLAHSRISLRLRRRPANPQRRGTFLPWT